MLWNFQCVKCLDEHADSLWNKNRLQDDEEKAGVAKQNSKKGFEKMSMPAAWRAFSWFRI